MSPKYGQWMKSSRLLIKICSGNYVQLSGESFYVVAPSSIPFSCSFKHINSRYLHRRCFSYRYSTMLQVSQVSPPLDAVSFIGSTFDELQGPYHYWFNRLGTNKDFFKREGTFLVLVGQFLDNSQTAGCDSVIMFEKVKLLQQRFPELRVMAFQSGVTACFADYQNKLVQLIMEEFLTFPILLSKKNLSEMISGASYLLFKDFQNPVIYQEKDLDVGILSKAVEELNMPENGNSGSSNVFKSAWSRPSEVIKEPPSSSSLQDLFLYFPGCVSADENGNRLFLSDSNHHRIIIFDDSGKILDCIGSGPGFEDGEFESAKLLRPAASAYDAAEDCLYIVDSENHAIRRADMGRRVLETLYPTCTIKKQNDGLLTWIMDKLGIRRDLDTKSGELDSGSLAFPWHIVKATDTMSLIISKSFETLWIIDLASGELKEVVKGFPKILEVCGESIMDKVSLLKGMPFDWLQQQAQATYSPGELQYAGLMSSWTTFQNHIIMCDIVGQRVLKLNRESQICSNIQFSNFGVLGLPYWLCLPLERVCANADGLQGTHIVHVQHTHLLPGRIDIRLTIDIPACTNLVEPLDEGSIWRQARGAAAEVSGVEGAVASTEKVGVAQQWYDELDNLAFSTPEPEPTVEEDDTPSNVKSEDKQVHLHCAVNTSPGTSEVIIYAALYFKLAKNPDLQEDSHEKYAERIADILKPESNGGMSRDSFIKFLLHMSRDLRDLIFLKPLHVRIKLDCLDHPKVDNSRNTILTNSSIEVNVSLDR